jgi:hypothetical protein
VCSKTLYHELFPLKEGNGPECSPGRVAENDAQRFVGSEIAALVRQDAMVFASAAWSREGLDWSWILPPYELRYGARALEPTEVVALNGKELVVLLKGP